MARILIVEENPASAAPLEDHLRLAGHQVELAGDVPLAVAKAADSQVDLVIMRLAPPAVAGVVLVRALRSREETWTVPILVLASRDAAAERLTIFRAGADEVLIQPVETEELLLRVDRLLVGREDKSSTLSGDLAAYPVWELMQYIDHARKSGELRIHGKGGSGRLRMAKGRVVSARWNRLAGDEALLAILDQEQGRFSFVTAAPGSADPAGDPLPDRHLMMEAGRLQDELDRRRELLPTAGAPLRWIDGAAPPNDEEYLGVPAAEVARQIRETGTRRLFDLLTAQFAAPQKVRLAVALLIERGAIEVLEEKDAYPTTRGIESSLLIDVAVGRVVATARWAGIDASPLPCLLLAEPGAWDELRHRLDRLPGSGGLEKVRRLTDQLRQRRGGSTLFECEEGQLSLHVQVLREAIVRQIAPIIPICAGVVVWLEEGLGGTGLEKLIERLSAEAPRNVVFIATSQVARRRLEQLVPAGDFRVSTEVPESLLGVLRLFQLGRGVSSPSAAPAAERRSSPPRAS